MYHTVGKPLFPNYPQATLRAEMLPVALQQSYIGTSFSCIPVLNLLFGKYGSKRQTADIGTDAISRKGIRNLHLSSCDCIHPSRFRLPPQTQSQ
jgi:hypothetical protein